MVWPFYLKGRCGKGFFHPKVYTTEALRPDQNMLTSPDEFASRCREIAKDNELGAALRDCGIHTFEEFYHTFRAKDRDLTDEEFDVCAADVHLTDYPSRKQVIQLKLLAIESKEIFEKSRDDSLADQPPRVQRHWGAPPPLRRKQQTEPSSSPHVRRKPQADPGVASAVPIKLTPSREKGQHPRLAPSLRRDDRGDDANTVAGSPSTLTPLLPFSSDNEELVTAVKLLKECEQMGQGLKLGTLQHRLISSTSLGFILECIKGSVVTISGTPGIGKSTLAVNMCKALGMTKIATTSKSFWLFGRPSAPHCQIWVYSNDSFYAADGSLNWTRLSQSMASITAGDEYDNGAIILEGHRIFEFPNVEEHTTSAVYLAGNDRLPEQRSRDAEQLAKLRTSAEKHKLYLQQQSEREGSLLKWPHLCTFSGDTPEMVLVCKLLQKIILDDKNIKTNYLNESAVDGIQLF